MMHQFWLTPWLVLHMQRPASTTWLGREVDNIHHLSEYGSSHRHRMATPEIKKLTLTSQVMMHDVGVPRPASESAIDMHLISHVPPSLYHQRCCGDRSSDISSRLILQWQSARSLPSIFDHHKLMLLNHAFDTITSSMARLTNSSRRARWNIRHEDSQPQTVPNIFADSAIVMYPHGWEGHLDIESTCAIMLFIATPGKPGFGTCHARSNTILRTDIYDDVGVTPMRQYGHFPSSVPLACSHPLRALRAFHSSSDSTAIVFDAWNFRKHELKCRHPLTP
ncbi:hypothetical protein BJV74DRAFT_597810 [Russula compacta]|nr:hypothetical protein BJV74DRAFT_416548 [Russula compacta]KAI0002394.1 hypothetical protein BJV74DRAFT_597810 [Russula compacta]